MFKLKRIKNILVRKVKTIWDRFHGYDFHSTIKSEDLKLNPKQFFNSSPSASPELIKVLDAQNFSSKDSILDIGCGKGSVLRLLLKYPFREIGGIEISKSLFDICIRNMQKINDSRVKLTLIDARYFYDYAKYNVFYTYNPCSKEIFEVIIQKIVGQSKGRKKFIYINPTCEEVLINYGFVLKSNFFDEWGNDIKIFELN